MCDCLILMIVVGIVLVALGFTWLRSENKTLHYDYVVAADVEYCKKYLTNSIPTFLQEYSRNIRT